MSQLLGKIQGMVVASLHFQDLRVAFGNDCNKAREHFSANGGNEGRDPSHDPTLAAKMQFDCYSYLGRYVDLKQHCGLDCTCASNHYFHHGLDENRNAAPDANIANHYHHSYHNWECHYYLAKYADLKAAFGSDCNRAKQHWDANGFKENRIGNAQFDCNSYLARYEDLRRAFGSNCAAATAHWFNHGVAEGRNADKM